MFILKKVHLGIILSVIVLVICEDEKPATEEEEKDPWDKSTDKYRHHLGSSSSSDTEEPVKIDVTEVSESEVHSSRSKLCKDCKTNIVVQEAPKLGNNTKVQNSTLITPNIRKEVDDETKEQIKDAIDEKDPVDSVKDTKTQIKHHEVEKKQGLVKKQLNHKIDFYPGSLWEYPYPYYHPQYGCGGKQGPCSPEAKPTEAKEDKTKKEKTANAEAPPKIKVIDKAKKELAPNAGEARPKVKVIDKTKKEKTPDTGEARPKVNKVIDKKVISKEKDATAVAALPNIISHDKKDSTKRKKEKVAGSVYPKIKGFGWVWKGPRVSEIGTSWGTPCWFNQEKKQFTCRQLVPSHYYGPPSAGWGGFQPGQTGSGWGTPYWYKRKCTVPHKNCRQIIPSHYYGPPSAGWGGFQPGHTGGGWGTPYWYKKCTVPHKHCRQLIPVHYYGPPSAGWGGFQPGYTGAGWGAPYWYKKCAVPQKDCRQIIPSHYYGPPSAGWGGFQPGHTGGGWGTPYWYKKCATPQVNCRQYIPSSYQPNRASWFMYRPSEGATWRSPQPWYKSGSLEARKHEVPLRYEHQPPGRLYSPRSIYSRYNIAALHEWISYLERQREKDRELERFRLKVKDRENERRYNLEVLHFNKNKKHHRLDTRSSHEESPPISYVVSPHTRVQEIDSPAIEYLFDNHEGAIYND